MIKLIIVAIISFVFGFFIKDILEKIGTRKRFQKVKSFGEMTSKERQQKLREL